MSFVLLTAKHDLLRRARDPLALLVWLAIPMAIAGLLNLAFGGGSGSVPRAKVLVVDQDDTFLSQFLLGAMGQQQGGELPFEAEGVTLEEGEARIEDGDASALLVIPAGFAEALLEETPIELRLVKNPAQTILPNIVEEASKLLLGGELPLWGGAFATASHSVSNRSSDLPLRLSRYHAGYLASLSFSGL